MGSSSRSSNPMMRSHSSSVCSTRRSTGTCDAKKPKVVRRNQTHSEAIRGHRPLHQVYLLGRQVCREARVDPRQSDTPRTELESQEMQTHGGRALLRQVLDEAQAAVMRANRRPSEAIRGHQRPSEAIRGHQRPSEAIRGHQALTCSKSSKRRSSGSSVPGADEIVCSLHQ